MAEETIDVVLSHPWRPTSDADYHEVGERLSLPAEQARVVVNAGFAQYATKSDARAAGAEDAPTRSKR